ncbi:Cytochrome P450 superfamily protein isoform 6 [Theobroma cacao]|uniref:Cytochrome P450 superfamily protein isoform 6 n=1 Tax=Theobroma cacao TaxID=3641 RepID=A0A061DLC7_THECC|nr:Cytochrome P450 superfamily protein isoform 6 [Theobroma cacao]
MAEGFWLVVLVGGVVGFLLGLVLNHFLPLLFKGGLVPKGTFGWPLLGETYSFLKPHSSNSVGAFLQDHCSRYGKVFRSHLFFSPTVVSCDPELNYFILQNEGKLFECSYPKPIHGILGKVSMLVAVDDTHKRLRNVALSLVSISKSKPEFLNDIESIAIQILDSWKDKPKVIFCEEARKFTFNVIVKQVLGLTPQEPETSKILEDFLTFMRGLISLPLYIPGTPYARAVQARSRISSSVKAIIEERRRNPENSKKRSDFVEILLSIDTLSEDEKVSFVLDSLLGGYETTSLLVSMVVHFLTHSPTALQQLSKNIRT